MSPQHYTLSKAVRNGQLVSLRGDKFIVCGRGATPYGVFMSGISRTVLELNGNKSIYTVPTGIVIRGEVMVGKGIAGGER